MPDDRISFADISKKLPAEWPRDPGPEIKRTFQALHQKVVVLDDDPTGTQSVQDVPVLTEWSTHSLRAEMASPQPVFYILTNSRSVAPAQARELNSSIAQNLVRVARELGRKFVVISRSDSTLRGHFPDELEALIDGLGEEPDGILLAPFFPEGGRYTIDDVQYVRRGEFLIPAGDTEFAQDAAFGYKASNLRQWVEEKTGGRILATQVQSISIADIRSTGPDHVADRLRSLSHRTVCVVNSASNRDHQVFIQGLLQAELEGKRFLCRVASSFVPIRCGLPPHRLLTSEDFTLAPGGGLIIVGSYVPTTSKQLEILLNQKDLVSVELDVNAALDPQRRAGEIEKVIDRVNERLGNKADVAVFTSRQLRSGSTSQENLSIGKLVSDALVDVVRGISFHPRYILAKGGITSSDIATKALGVRRAMVKGQLLPGVPVWELGPESRYPGTPYVVFPGNVGDSDALIAVRQLLLKVPSETVQSMK